jgi:hypothetical protein
MRRHYCSIPLLVVSLSVIGMSRRSLAQEPGSTSNHTESPAAPDPDQTNESVEVIEARRLFLEGRELLNQGHPREACTPLERSQKLAPAIGTLLNLGMCHSYAGHLATAHEYYRQAEVLATLQQDTRRREHAHDAAAALAPRRATLTLRIPTAPDAKLEVRVDEIVQPREIWSNPMYIDAGDHRIVVQSPDKQSWQGIVTVVDGNKHVIEIPELQSTPATSIDAAHSELVSPQGKPETVISADSILNRDQVPPDDAGLGTTRLVALGVGGAGIAALGASLIYTIAARSTYDDSSRSCRSNDVCGKEGIRLRDDARADAGRATVFGIAGGAALVGGVLLWFLAQPPAEKPRATTLTMNAGAGSVSAEFTSVL